MNIMNACACKTPLIERIGAPSNMIKKDPSKQHVGPLDGAFKGKN